MDITVQYVSTLKNDIFYETLQILSNNRDKFTAYLENIKLFTKFKHPRPDIIDIKQLGNSMQLNHSLKRSAVGQTLNVKNLFSEERR